VLRKIQHQLNVFSGQGDTLRQEGVECLLRGIFERDDALLARGHEIDQILARRGTLRVIAASDPPATYSRVI
jgi:hypothetical protein